MAEPAGAASVRLRFTPSPEHVRTARLVAVSVARRLGYDEASLDEIRLAVGEACARAVRRCAASFVDAPVEVGLVERPGLVVEVEDSAGPAAEGGAEDLVDDVDGDAVSLALVEGLADSVELPGRGGGLLRLRWDPPEQRAAAGS